MRHYDNYSASGSGDMGSLTLAFKMLKGKLKLLALSLLLIILATSLVIGILLTADYLVYASAKQKYMSLPVDMYASVNFANRPSDVQYSGIRTDILSIQGVTEIHYLYDVYIYKVDINVTNKAEVYRIEEWGCIFLGIDFNDPFWRDNIILVGNDSYYPLRDDEILVDYNLAQWMNLKVGDTLNIMRYDIDLFYDRNITVTGFFKVGDFLNYHLMNVEKVVYYGVFITNIETAIDIMSALYTTPVFQFRYHIWIDREKVINPWDKTKTMKQINSLEVEISKKIHGMWGVYHAEIKSPLKETLVEFYKSSEEYGSQLVFAILLVLVFVALSTLIGGELTIETRRREIGLLKIRGSSSGGLSRVTFIEWLLMGLLGGFLGFLISPILTFILVNIISPSFASRYFVLNVISPVFSQYLGVSISLGLSLSMLSVILPTRRVAQIKPLDAIREYLEEEELSATKGINRRFNVFLVIAGSYFLADFILGLPVISTILDLAHASGASVLINIAEILHFLEVTIMPLLAPFFIVIGAGNIIVSFSDRFAGAFSIIVRPLVGRASIIASKNFGRRPARTALIIFMLTFTIITNLTFGSGIATVRNHIIVDTKMKIGADIKVEITSLRPFDFINDTIITDVWRISGVKSVIRCFIETFEHSYYFGRIHVVGLDPSYFSLLFKDAYLEEANLETVNSQFASQNITIVNMGAEYKYNLSRGDIIRIRDPYRPSLSLINYHIIGFYKFLPGVFEDMLYPQLVTELFAVVNLETIWLLLEQKYVVVVPEKTILFITVEENADIDSIAQQIEIMLSSFQIKGSVQVMKRQIKRMLEEEFSGALLSLYEAGLLFASTLIALVIFVSVSISIYERRRELALLRVRGFTRRSIIKMLVGEAFLVALVSLSISLPVSLAMIISWVSGGSMMMPYLTQYLQMIKGIEYPPEWALFILPADLLIYLVLIFICFVLSYIIPYMLISRHPLPEEVRIHH